MGKQRQPLFLFGAGFNADAAAAAGGGRSITVEGRDSDAAYPLVSHLAQACFDLDAIPHDKSIEEMFDDCRRINNSEPFKRLADVLFYADSELAPKLIDDRNNCYSRFFDRFATSQFLTFNYDSLPELFLLKKERWYPHDGYGVPVEVEACFNYKHKSHTRTRDHLLKQCSQSLVLHLHGSFCLYPSTFTFERRPNDNVPMLFQREKPEFIFDPDSITNLFKPFTRVPPVIGAYTDPQNRIIAPVPDKTEGLKGEFVSAVYMRAEELLCQSKAPLVVIGYSFNPHDRASYERLLIALQSGSASMLLVSPDASEVERRILPTFPSLNIEAQDNTLQSWIEADFPGL